MNVFRTKEQLIKGFDDILKKLTQGLKEEGKSIFNQGWVKTQIAEVNIETSGEETGTGHEKTFSKLRQISTEEINFEELSEENLFVAKVNASDHPEVVYLDTADSRFWVLYSSAKNMYFDKFTSFLFRQTLFDSAWFPIEFLNGLKEKGRFCGYGGRFNNEVFVESDDEEEMLGNLFKISFKSWGDSSRLLELIQKDQELRNSFALTNLRIMVETSSSAEDSVIDDVTFSGKITSIGESFIAHRRLVEDTVSRYSAIITNIEDELGLVVKTAVVDGEPLEIIFSEGRRLQDPVHFAEVLCSGREPFRLWGTIISKDSEVVVNAVDLHVGELLYLNINPERMKIYLPADTCANTILRMYALLQQSYDSLISISTLSGNKLLKQSDHG